jgi:hypothetical protein
MQHAALAEAEEELCKALSNPKLESNEFTTIVERIEKIHELDKKISGK